MHDAAAEAIERGYAQRARGELARALASYEAGSALLRRGAEPLRFAHTSRHVADIRWQMGDADAAIPVYEEAVAIYRECVADARPLDVANALAGYARLKYALGDRAGALPLFRESRDLYAVENVRAGVEECERLIAAIGPA